jgi:CubicO group peptidase (beta-lactamase class C family)
MLILKVLLFLKYKEVKTMSRKNIFQSLAVLAVLALVLRIFAKPLTAPASAKAAPDSASYAAIDAYVEQQMQRLNIPGVSLAIVEGDQIVHLRGFGQARPGGEVPSPQTPFFIGSLTKSFTALAVMQLVEAGKVALDAPVQRYLPWFRVADSETSAQMTVRHLLHQTSGLSTASGWIPLADLDDDPAATERQARALASFKCTRPVGTAFEYSNANYNLLGLIIESASGEAYANYIQNHILNPLEMRHSYTSQTVAKQNGLAVGHRYWFWVPIAEPEPGIPTGSLPSGQLISSAEDMARYLTAYINGGRSGKAQILSSAGIDALQQGAADVVEMGVSAGQYGMGWFVSGSGPTKTIWHTGNVPDFSAYMALLPEQKKGVILLFNADHFMMTPILAEFGGDVASLLAGQQPAPSPYGFRLISFVPWAMRTLLLIPLLQIGGVVFTLQRLRRWRQDPQSRPSRGRMWGQHILLPLVPNLFLAALPFYLLVSKMLGFMLLFFPDFSWIALICGSLAGVWAFLRTRLILQILQPSALSRRQAGSPLVVGSER